VTPRSMRSRLDCLEASCGPEPVCKCPREEATDVTDEERADALRSKCPDCGGFYNLILRIVIVERDEATGELVKTPLPEYRARPLTEPTLEPQ
jgi:hypothetical protein